MKRPVAALLLALAAPASADSSLPTSQLADTQLPDVAQEAQARALMQSVRCLVCQGQSIADSDAELAGDMRALIRSRVAQGEAPSKIRGWLVERYGKWVSYDPPLDAATLPLWLAPLLLIGGGVLLVRKRFKRRPQ